VCSAAGTDIGVDGVEIEIGDPLVDGSTAAKGYNNELVGVVNRYVTRNIGRCFFSDRY
jgi:hypothetical protein